MAAKKRSTAVATTTSSAVPAKLSDAFQEDAGQGLELAGRDDFAIPFIKVLQGLSPEVDEEDDGYIPDAKPGMLLNSVTGEIFDGKQGLLVIPAHFEKVFNEFVPRKTGGGFRGSYNSHEEALEAVEEGNEIIDTANHYVLVSGDGGETWSPALISCTSTKLKVSRQWNAKMRMLRVGKEGEKFNPPTFATVYSLTTVGQQNAKGKFHNIATELVGMVQEPETYELAKIFRDAVTTGRGRVDYDAGQETEEDGSSSVEKGAEF